MGSASFWLPCDVLSHWARGALGRARAGWLRRTIGLNPSDPARLSQKKIEKNQAGWAGWDRGIRIALGLGLLSLTVVGPQTLWGLLGLVPRLTGLGAFVLCIGPAA